MKSPVRLLMIKTHRSILKFLRIVLHFHHTAHITEPQISKCWSCQIVCFTGKSKLKAHWLQPVKKGFNLSQFLPRASHDIICFVLFPAASQVSYASLFTKFTFYSPYTNYIKMTIHITRSTHTIINTSYQPYNPQFFKHITKALKLFTTKSYLL